MPLISLAEESYLYTCNRIGKDFTAYYEINPSDKTIIFISSINNKTKKKYSVNSYHKANTWIDNIVTVVQHRPRDRITIPIDVEDSYELDWVNYKTFYLDDDLMINTSHYSYQEPQTSKWKCSK